MTRLPQLERDLVDAARRRRGRRPVLIVRRVMRPALAFGLLAAVAVGLAMAAGPGDPEREVTGRGVERVPPATFELSERLARADVPKARPPIDHSDLPAAAERLEAQTPYPPGRSDDFDWSATPKDPRDMGSISSPADVQRLVEYRAGCLWLRYWLDAHEAGNIPARDDALRILRDSRSWPTERNLDDAGRGRAGAAERADAAAVRRELEQNCSDRTDPVDHYQDRPPEAGSRYTVEPRTLARDSHGLAIVGYEVAFSGREPTLCLDLVFIREGSSSGCFSASERAQGTAGGMHSQHAVGATGDEVDAVEVSFRDGGQDGIAHARLLRAADAATLGPLGLQPFTFYVAEMPRNGVPLTTTAKLGGQVVWRAEFPNAPG